MEVAYIPQAEAELGALPVDERVAIVHAVEKLRALGVRLPFPHQSSVKGATNLRELRPRGGRSRWRAFYRQIGDTLVIGAIGSEAGVDPHGFRRSVILAEQRLNEVEAEE